MQAPCIGMQGKMLPSVTTEDNGDVLTVVNGEWSKASGGSGLPEVTAEDDGDVLTVVDGEWQKASGGGGGSTRVIFDVSEESGSVEVTCDKTYDQIISAINSGDVSFVVRIGEDGVRFQSSLFDCNDGGSVINIMFLSPQTSTTLSVFTIDINSENSIGSNIYNIQWDSM